MCGIAGFVSADGAVRNGAALLAQFERDLHHRGPDDHGSFLSVDGRVGLAATRLAILDLSPAGHQPMRSSDGQHVIAFNGEIYNYRGLRAELEARGAAFRSNSDTEVVLELYRSEGADCVKRLRGMFAFAVWSDAEATCFLARDPLGIKPLYYHVDERRKVLAFASELKPLIRSGLVPKTINPNALRDYFRTGSVSEPETLIAGVNTLEAGSWMRWSRGEVVERKKYWGLKFGNADCGLRKREPGEEESGTSRVANDQSEAARIVRAALLESIEHHFVSDVPVGLFLSGGIDSTALLAMARAGGRENLQTFSVGVADEGLDESGVASRTASHFKTRHEVMQLDGRKAKEIFGEFLQHMDQPSVDGFNTFVVSRFAHACGMKVVLSGLGGDELFGGYGSFTRVPQMVRWSRGFGPLSPVRRRVGDILSRFAPRPNARRLGDFLTGEGTLEAAYASFRGIFTSAEAIALTTAVTSTTLETDVDARARDDEYPTAADAVSALEMTRYMRNQLLRDSDVMSMANSLELRVPFVDRELVDRVTALPAAIRIRDGKRLLLEAAPEIPEWVASAPKRGFRFPFEQWITEEWTSDSRLAAAANVRPTSWYQRWTIYVLEEWLRQIA